MADCVLGIGDWTRELGVTATAENGVPTMPAGNLIDTRLGRRCRWSSTTGTVTFDLGAPRLIGAIVAAQPLDAYDRSRDYAMLDAADAVTHRLSLVAPGDGEVLDVTVASGIVQRYGLHAYFPEEALLARWCTFSFDAASYVARGQGFVDWGKYFVSTVLRRTYGTMPHYSSRPRDRSLVTASDLSGLEFVDRRPMQRVLSFSFDALTEDEGRSTFADAALIAGKTEQVFFARDPDSPYLGRDAILGRFEDVPGIDHPSIERYSAQYMIRQSL